MTKVINIKSGEPYHVYCGRESLYYKLKESMFCNPFVIGKDGTREEVIKKYENYFLNSPKLLNNIGSLKNKVLGCWCSPHACHGDILVKHANKENK